YRQRFFGFEIAQDGSNGHIALGRDFIQRDGVISTLEEQPVGGLKDERPGLCLLALAEPQLAHVEDHRVSDGHVALPRIWQDSAPERRSLGFVLRSRRTSLSIDDI